jgi:hypothetical protein
MLEEYVPLPWPMHDAIYVILLYHVGDTCAEHPEGIANVPPRGLAHTIIVFDPEVDTE